MRLLIDCHCFDADTTEGINTYIRGIYSILPKIAPNIEFYFAAKNTAKIESIFGHSNNIKYISLSGKNKFYRLIFEYPRIIKNFKIDWAHFQYNSPFIKNCKTIVTLHDILFKDFPKYFPLNYRIIKGLLFKFSAKRSDILCTVSKYSQKRIAHHYNIPIKNIIVTPNAVSNEFSNIPIDKITKFKLKKGIENYILYVSRREPRKNQISLLKSWDRIINKSNNDIDLVFIGRPTLNCPDFEKYLKNLDESKKRKVHIIDNVSFEELKLWYSAASLFVYPALAEGFGIPPIEAAFAGIPVICNNATAMGDFTFFGKNLIDFSDENLLDNRIISILQNPIDSKNSTDDIKSKIQQIYTWKTSANILFNALR